MTARPQDVALLSCQFPPAAFEEWFASVEAGDGSIPIPQSIADGEAWHEYIGRRQMALGAWIAATDAALASAQAREEELRADHAAVIECKNIDIRERDAAIHGWAERARAAEARAERLAEALRELDRAYVRLLESGRDRIRDLGGECDPVDVMERSDIDLRKARAALTNAAQPGETNEAAE